MNTYWNKLTSIVKEVEDSILQKNLIPGETFTSIVIVVASIPNTAEPKVLTSI